MSRRLFSLDLWLTSQQLRNCITSTGGSVVQPSPGAHRRDIPALLYLYSAYSAHSLAATLTASPLRVNRSAAQPGCPLPLTCNTSAWTSELSTPHFCLLPRVRYERKSRLSRALLVCRQPYYVYGRNFRAAFRAPIVGTSHGDAVCESPFPPPTNTAFETNNWRDTLHGASTAVSNNSRRCR